jgi:methionyl-tRNA synthetase
MSKTFFITTAIDYTNSPPHIGHAYEKILADVIARYQRLKGEKVFFLTGADQHGQKVQQSAAKAGVTPSEFVKGITQKFKDLYQKLDVKYDEWAETISPRHKKVVQVILQRLFDAGQIYKDKQSGYYSIRQEQFLTDKERGPDGEFGPEWGQVEFREEENYYFKLNDHKKWLADYLANRKDAVIPDFRQTELRNAVEKLSGDLCISRPKSRLDWGIELPFDKNFVTYVWFDALTNYISFSGYDPKIDNYVEQPPEFLDRWPALQIIGKDILVPAHGVYWLIMLHAIGFPDDAMPQLLVHGFWNMGGAKMSKSLGNIVDPNELVDKYGVEAVRFYLVGELDTGSDADFSETRLAERYNSDLANGLGNLLNRSLNMLSRYRNGRLANPRTSNNLLRLLRVQLESITIARYEFCLASQLFGNIYRISDALEQIFGRPELLDPNQVNDSDSREQISQLAKKEEEVTELFGPFGVLPKCNWLIETLAPWKLARDEANAAELSAILYYLVESLRIIAILISPVLPKAAHGIFDQLNWKMELSGKEDRFSLKDAEWGGLPDGQVVGKPVPLFPRIEIKASEET